MTDRVVADRVKQVEAQVKSITADSLWFQGRLAQAKAELAAVRTDAEKAWALVDEVAADFKPPADEWQRQWLAKVEQAKRERGT